MKVVQRQTLQAGKILIWCGAHQRPRIAESELRFVPPSHDGTGPEMEVRRSLKSIFGIRAPRQHAG
jgi:hypothetical protein